MNASVSRYMFWTIPVSRTWRYLLVSRYHWVSRYWWWHLSRAE